MARILYPALQAPVLTATQRPETVTESRWHQPWSEPVLGVRAKQIAAVALIASGMSFCPLPLPNFNPQADSYNYRFSEPVRIKPGLNAALQQSFTVDPTALTRLESVTIDRWLLPLTEPVRVKARLHEANQWASTVSPTALLAKESVTIDRFLLPLSEPVRQKVGLRAIYHPPHTQVLLSAYRRTYCFGCIMVSGKRIG